MKTKAEEWMKFLQYKNDQFIVDIPRRELLPILEVAIKYEQANPVLETIKKLEDL